MHRPEINTEVLRLDREWKGLSHADVARKIGMSEYQYQLMEEGAGEYPTQRQLREISKLLDRPVWFFFLDEMPEEERKARPSLRYRGGDRPISDVDVYKALRDAGRYRELALEAAADVEEFPRFTLRAGLGEDPDVAANRVRHELSIQEGTPDEAYNYWRSRIERAGVLVFHFSVRAFAGFAVHHDLFPVVGVSTKERSRKARLFTLAHELGHLLLGDSTVHDMGTGWFEYRSDHEKWCNRFAAALILPARLVRTSGRDPLATARRLSDTYGLSVEATVWRMEDLGLVDRSVAERLASSLAGEPSEKRKSQSGEARYYSIQLAKLGYLLPSLIERSTSSGGLSEAQVVPMLDMRGHTYRELMERHSKRRLQAL